MSKQLERKIEITSRWWREDDRPVAKHHVDELDKIAMREIRNDMANGLVEGEMHFESDRNIFYRGYWEVKQS